MRIVWLISCAALLMAGAQYAAGQDLAPAFDGWRQNPDGTYSFVFGYLNGNSEEELDVPVGPKNNVDVGGDAGQPTHFYPGRRRFVFKVTVSKSWDKTKSVIWTLTSHGQTHQAKGWLQPELELNDDEAPGNEPPGIVGSSAETVTLPNTLTLAVIAADDGIPKLPGLSVKWIVYRGAGKVRFDPDTSPVSYGKPISFTSKVSFSTPGEYVLQAIASDGQLSTTYNVTVTVK